MTPMVIVYGPDGTPYSSPAAAIEAGVMDYSMTPPGSSSVAGTQFPPMMPPGDGGQFPPMMPPVAPPMDIAPPMPPMAPPMDRPIQRPMPEPVMGIAPMPMPMPMPEPPMGIAPPPMDIARLPTKGRPDGFMPEPPRERPKPMEITPPGIGGLDYDALTKQLQKQMEMPKGVDEDIVMRDLMKNMVPTETGTNAGAISSLPGMNLPVPRRATGMETLVSPRMMRRER